MRRRALNGFGCAFALMLLFVISNAAHGQSCQELSGITFAQNELYAITRGEHAIKKTLLSPLLIARNDLEFDNKVKLIYVLDQPQSQPQTASTKRDFAGVFAVRLVSTSLDGKTRQPLIVYLKRDSIKTRKVRNGLRPEWDGQVNAARYYVYHSPKEVRASDSLLERQFHTTYTYKPNEPDRNTFEDRERRSKFHFNEMTAEPTADGFLGFIAGLFGGGSALASGPASRFESQIKYYPYTYKPSRTSEPRCLSIETRIDKTDNGQLKITITDLDYPGIAWQATENWTINWIQPQTSTTR